MRFPYATDREHAAVLVHPKFIAAKLKADRAYLLTRDKEMRKAERIETRARQRFKEALRNASEILRNAEAKGQAAKANIERAAYASVLADIRAQRQS